MKKSKLAFLTIASLLLSISVFGQNTSVFKVFANKGQAEVKTGETRQPLKTGVSLKENDVIVLGENSYVALVHSASGSPKELKQAGSYPVKDLTAGIKTGASVMSKYTEFILSSNSAEAKRNRLSATGAVHRGLDDIKVFLPEQPYTKVYNSAAVIKWETKSGQGAPYIVRMENMFGDLLMEQETSEQQIVLDLSNPKLASEQDVMVKVRSKSEAKSSSREYIIHKMKDSNQVQKIRSELSEFDLSEENALNKFILAGFYEEHKLFIDAIAAYEDAIRLAPDVDSYKEAYEEFLLRNKLKEPK
ncbi:MAG: hypothetical protein ACO3FI_02245 [Cyclobacteriaceae bacterium]